MKSVDHSSEYLNVRQVRFHLNSAWHEGERVLYLNDELGAPNHVLVRNKFTGTYHVLDDSCVVEITEPHAETLEELASQAIAANSGFIKQLEPSSDSMISELRRTIESLKLALEHRAATIRQLESRVFGLGRKSAGVHRD